MKTFEDLEFKPRCTEKDLASMLACGSSKMWEAWHQSRHAVMHFKNGYGVSVLLGAPFYSNGVDTYELAVLYGDRICYKTDITDDVLGWLTKEDVTRVMKRVQNLSQKNPYA